MKFLVCFFSFFLLVSAEAQHISSFLSVEPNSQSQNMILPTTHRFHFIIATGDSLADGSLMPGNPDFTGYISIAGSNKNGYLCVNSESVPGGVTILNVRFDTTASKWKIDSSVKVNFASVGGTRSNCAGGITPWGTLVTCEEITSSDLNFDGYNDYGWAVEINPVTKTVINHPGGLLNGDKLWALGNYVHENICFHTNRRTIYQGADAATGYLFKFVADSAEKLYKGKLYAYKGSKNGNGRWVRINNSTQAECNATNQRCNDSICTSFSGIEEVEYNPADGRVYLAVKGEDRVYSFADDSLLKGDSVHGFKTFVGNTSYNITHINGTTSTPWGTGNDNLCFDDLGNLWVFQDGSNNHIWLVENGHTQASPKVKLFARTPAGSEPTGITFTPDYKYMFMSIQHPSGSNNTSQNDAFGQAVIFDKAVSLVVARDSSFIALPIIFNRLWGHFDGYGTILNWQTSCEHNSYGFFIERSIDGVHWQNIGMQLSENSGCQLTNYTFNDHEYIPMNCYYRIRQTDMDGAEYISECIMIEKHFLMLNQTDLYPNPSLECQKIYCNGSEPFSVLDFCGNQMKIIFYISGSGWFFNAPAQPGIYTLVRENGRNDKFVVQ